MRAIDVEELAWQWREALRTAQVAADATRFVHGADRLRNAELARLTAERKLVATDLRAVADVHRLRVEVGHLALSLVDVRRLLGLPHDVTTCVFNLDGVLIPSAALHAAAWREAFDEFVIRRSERTRGRFAPFSPQRDYFAHIHGKPRLEGVRALLESRGIRLPEGAPDDPVTVETVHGLANRKKEALLRRLRADRLDALQGSRHYLEVAREAGLHRVVVSASANARQMLEGAGLAPYVEECIDGSAMTAEHLQAKPAPDLLLAACSHVASDPHHAVAFETSAEGVAAARSAEFELVLGVDDGTASGGVHPRGADRVVSSLAELLEQQVAA